MTGQPPSKPVSYEDTVRAAAAALPPLTQEARDRLTLLLRGARPDQDRRAS